MGIGWVVAGYPDSGEMLRRARNASRASDQVKFAAIQAQEKVSRGIELTATGPSRTRCSARQHGHHWNSRKLSPRSVVARAVLFNDTTREFFRLMATVSSPADARYPGGAQC